MDNLASGALDDSPHDVDGGVVTVKQACCCYNANLVFRAVGSAYVHDCILNQMAANLLAGGQSSQYYFR
jgi:hypothetical protein